MNIYLNHDFDRRVDGFVKIVSVDLTRDETVAALKFLRSRFPQTAAKLEAALASDGDAVTVSNAIERVKRFLAAA